MIQAGYNLSHGAKLRLCNFLWKVSSEKKAFKRNLVKKEIENLSRYGRVQKAAVEEMSSISLQEREKRMSKARIEQNTGRKKKFKENRQR